MNYDYVIIGAGLAGVHLSNELLKTGASVCLLEEDRIAAGASGTSIGLANPATGRYASQSWEAEHCLNAVVQNLEIVQQTTSSPFFKQSGVLRPALEEMIAEKMRANLQASKWPDGWANWLDKYEIDQLHPGITCKIGGVWIPVALTVDVPSYLKAFVELQVSKSLSYVEDQIIGFENRNSNWLLALKSGSTIKSHTVIFTTGIQSNELDYWKHLPFIPVKGQIATYRTKKALTFQHSISASGYLGTLDTHSFVMGSTYQHKFEHVQPDEYGKEYLTKKLKKVLPDLADHSEIVDQWAGVRASTPNRMPIIGTHPNYENLHIYAGLGSKGLIYSSYLAQLLVAHLEGKDVLPDEMNINRFLT